jgi:transposase
MYFNSTVKIPDSKGKIITKKKGDASYILYQYGTEYNKDKKYSVPKRCIIGKVSEKDPSLMFPNEKFETYFPNADIPEVLPYAYRSCSLKIGSYIVIQKLIDEYKLKDLLKKRFGDDTGLILDLIAYLIIEEENAGQYYPDFAFDHPLFSKEMKIYSDSKVSRLLNDITVDQRLNFLDDWNKNMDHNSRIYISYDSTNKNSAAGDIDILEFGKAKDDKGLPIFNVSIAMDKTNRVPLFYEEYPGSIIDMSQFTFMVDKVAEYGYKQVGFVLDRGYFSKENIQYMDDNCYTFIIMCKGCKDLVSSLIQQVKGSFETKRSASIRSYKAYGTTVISKLYDDDKQERYFHIYYKPSKLSAEREQLEIKIDKYRQFLDKHIGKTTRFDRTYQQYFDLTYSDEGILIDIKENEEVIEKELQLCGYFCIITSEKMSATQALIQYKGRDISEKLFKTDKTFIGSKSERVQSSESMSSKIFIEFIALIIRNRMYNLLKEKMIESESNKNFMTVPASIRELEKIEIVRRNSGKYKLDHAITKTQKIILSAYNIDEEDVIESAKKISGLLTNCRSLMDNEIEDNNEDED